MNAHQRRKLRRLQPKLPRGALAGVTVFPVVAMKKDDLFRVTLATAPQAFRVFSLTIERGG